MFQEVPKMYNNFIHNFYLPGTIITLIKQCNSKAMIMYTVICVDDFNSQKLYLAVKQS